MAPKYSSETAVGAWHLQVGCFKLVPGTFKLVAQLSEMAVGALAVGAWHLQVAAVGCAEFGARHRILVLI